MLTGIKNTLSNEPVRPATEPNFPGDATTPIHHEPRYPGTLPPVWNIPRRNPNFTGRDTLLEELRESLTREHHTALTQQAIYGLGGIGKTQLAIEYTYLNSSSYEYAWW
ncbi:MAG: toll/interleukin-1 receptor domain-containing protein, partial [Chlorobiaceae bacterium]